MVEDLDDYEPGLNLDNDSLIVTGDQGIPIRDFYGQQGNISHDEQRRMRDVQGCVHASTTLTVEVTPTTAGNTKMIAGGRMSYMCDDCGRTIIEGHVTNFNYRLQKTPDDFNNPFLTGQH